MTTTYPPKSRQQFVDRALSVLGVVPSGQTPDDDDRLVVDDLVVPLLAQLDAEGVTTIDDPNAIPAAQFLPLSVLLAEMAMQEFGLAALPQADPAAARRQLHVIVSVGPTMETVEEYDCETGETTTYQQPQTATPEWY